MLDGLQGFKIPLPFPDLAKGCKEALAAFSFPINTQSPLDVIANANEASEFWFNKTRKWGKDNTKPEFGVFCNAFRDVLKAMGEWVKENAKMGLTWNAKGDDVKDYKPVGGDAAAPAAAAPAPAPVAAAPAPAPAPSAVAAAPAPAAATPAAGGAPPLAALFAQISSIDQSKGKTEGLRHVTKDMKSSANKDAPPAVPAAASAPKPAAASAPKPATGGIKMGDPKVALTGTRWDVQYITKESQKGEILKITDANMKQDIYIYGCK